MNKTYRFIIVIFLLFNITPFIGNGQEKMVVDEIAITLNIQQIGNLDLSALIHNQDAYLPISDFFDFLKIKNSISKDFITLDGFFIDPKSPFQIDYVNNLILYQGQTFPLKKNELILNSDKLYLKSSYFGQIFGLTCIFNFRNLSISVSTTLELPAIREMKMEQMRKNTSALQEEKLADTIIGQEFPLFSLGVADWSFTSTQEGFKKTNTRADLALGAMIAGGEATVNLNYNSNQPFSQRNQYYRWKYVNNEHTAFRQITAGRIYTQSIATVYAPVTGFQVTNTPTTYKRSFGTYQISNTTEPGWMVELYVNNILVNFVKSDASGFYTFDVPLVYGNSAIKLRFYGPWGEERIQEQNISIPFNFLPAAQFEYNISAGLVEDFEKSIYSKINFNYGINNRITIGSGIEYLSSVNNNQPMPFINSSMRLTSSLLFSGEYTYGVRAKGILNYRLPANVQLELNYIKYEKEQTAIRFNYDEERRASLSAPLQIGKFSAFSRFSYHQYVLPNSKITNAEFLISAFVYGLSSNFTTYALYSGSSDPYIYSNLSLTFRLPLSFKLTPHIQYEYKQKNISMMKAEVEKRLGIYGFANLAYEKNRGNSGNIINLGLRLNFSFVQTAFSVTHGNERTTTSQSAGGSLLYNDQTNHLSLNKESHTGKGGLIILPFLDLNCNGKRDPNEPRVAQLKLKGNRGNVIQNKRDTTISITGLEAYTNYIIELEKNSFDNISWQLKNKTISITIEPNHFKKVEVPIAVFGEANGNVYQKNQEGMGRMIVNFYSNSTLVGKTVTEPDGFFSFMGLAPGKYTAHVDGLQLEKLQMKASPTLSFTIKSNKNGDVVEGLQFILEQDE